MKVFQKSPLNIMYDCQYWGALSTPPHKTLLTWLQRSNLAWAGLGWPAIGLQGRIGKMKYCKWGDQHQQQAAGGEHCGEIRRSDHFIISTQLLNMDNVWLGLIFSLLQPIINESFLCWIRRYVCSVKFCIDRDWYWYACIKLPLLHCEEQIIFMHIEVKHQISSFDGSCHCHCILFSRLWNIVIIWGKINEWKK